MNIHDVSVYSTGVQLDLNPPMPAGEPAKVDAWPLIGQVAFFDPRRVKPMDGQPRGSMEGARIDELAAAIKATGQEEVAKAFPINHPDFDVELIGSHRRRESCLLANCMIKLLITHPPRDRLHQYMQAVAGNCNRLDLTPLDQMRAVVELIHLGCPRQEVATLFGKTIGWVNQFWGLRTLNPEVFPLLARKPEDMYDATGRKLRRVTILPLSYALKIIRLPSEDHLAAAQAMLEENMDVVAAERFVSARLHEKKGDQGTDRYKTKKLRDQLQMLHNQAQSFENTLMQCVGMSHEQLMRIGGEDDVLKRDLFGSRLRRIAETTRWLAEVINPRHLKIEQVKWLIKNSALESWVLGQLAAYTLSGLPLEAWMELDPKRYNSEPKVRDGGGSDRGSDRD